MKKFPMEERPNGRLIALAFCLVMSCCIEDSSHFFVVASHQHSGSGSGSGGRTQRLQTSRQRLLEHRGIKQEHDRRNLTARAAYRSNKELREAMKEYANRCGHISRVYSIGKSVRGVPLMVLEISDAPGQFEPEPAFKYVANMHGDEPSGRELSLHLAEWLCANYLKNPLATLIVEKVHLHLLPSLNPDGFESKTRNNANDVDLNRDFPDQFFPFNNNESGRQPETKAVMQWVRNTHFAASASLHEGALVASYGWDGTVTGRTGYAEGPDDAGFRYMASLYAQFNPSMKKNPEFVGGVTNGAAWYPLYGGMQDWNYIHGDCFEITLEMCDAKWPNISKIPALWYQHQQSMLELVASVARSGVHGRVVSSVDGRPLPASISVRGIGHEINASSAFGDYHRILPPGKNYELTARFPGYISRTTTVVLSHNKATALDFVLDPVPTSEVFPQERMMLRGFQKPRIPVDDGFDWGRELELAPPPTEAEAKAVELQALPPRDRGYTSLLSRKYVGIAMDDAAYSSEVTVEQLRVISAGVTVIVVAAIVFILVRWRRSLRPQVTVRHTSRRN